VKIDPNVGIPEGQSPNRVGASASAPVARPSQPVTVGNDQASLSNDAVKLSNLSAALNNVPEIRQERVSAISQQLKNGTYSVSDQQIARAMVRDYAPQAPSGS